MNTAGINTSDGNTADINTAAVKSAAEKSAEVTEVCPDADARGTDGRGPHVRER
ncbi:hypothetical protein ACIRPU_12885 [Streptomyces sp. NPDC102259]|uniref:hypothetical protein n=1 Tax=Streptomyces sp. NPDC102259 TaxID=3366148 RepID=UPI00381F4C41